MSLLDDDLDVNEPDLLAKICLWYFEKYGYWKRNDSYAPTYPCTTDGIYRRAEFYEVIKEPEKYGLCALPNYYHKLIEIVMIPLEGLEEDIENQYGYISSKLCKTIRPVGVDDTMTIKDILECYESV